MTQTQLLLSIISLIPLSGTILVSITKNHPKIFDKIILTLSIIFLINSLMLLSGYLHHHNDSLVLFKMNRDIAIGFSLEPISLIFLILLALIWITITCHNNQYFTLSSDKKLSSLQIFSCLIIGFITLIFLSKNLVSMFLFYQSLIFTLHFFSAYFLLKSDTKSSYNFTFLLLLSSTAFLLAIIFTYKLTGQIEFSGSGIIKNNLSVISYAWLLMLYLIGICPIAFAPLYLLYGNLYYLSSPIIIIIFVIAYGLVSLFTLLKIIAYIFGAMIFVSYNQQFDYSYLITYVLAANLLLSALLAITCENLKKTLIYLFFNQLILAILSFFILGKAVYQITITIISLTLSQILIFLSMGNINLYLLNSKQKTLNGIFYKLKITSLSLIFALLNIIGLVPSIGLIEKYLIIKQTLKTDSKTYGIIILVNIILNIICLWKIIYPIIKISSEEVINSEEARKIQGNWHLMLPIILISSIMFLGFLFPSFIINFSKRIF